MSILPSKEVPTHNLRRAVIANAVGTGTYTIGLGTAIQPGATGHVKFVTAATSSNPILGVVVAIEYQNKIVELSSVAGINAASTAAAPGTDNETAGYWKVVYIPSNVPVDYVCDTSAALGTTTDSAGHVYFNLISLVTGATGGATLDESSVALFSGTQGQFFSYGADPAQPSNTKAVVAHVSKVL